MYAVIQSGGKQYRVTKGDTIKVEKIDADQGATIDFEKILMVGEGNDTKIGGPFVDGSKVTAVIKSHGRSKKIKIVKFRRRKHYQKIQGHRQSYTELEITEIQG